MPGMYSVACSIFVGAGSRLERPEDAGSAHLIEHMLFKGTERRPTAEIIAETIERVGGLINASTDKELTTYWVKVARPNMDTGLDVLADMLLHSTFAAAEVEKERRVVIEELGMSLDSPQDWVHTLIDEQVWPDTALGRDVAGTKESVAGLRRDGLLAFRRATYRPSQAVVSLAGSIEHERAIELARDLFAAWREPEEPVDGLLHEQRVEYTSGQPMLYYEARETEQVNLCLAVRGVSRESPRRYAFDLLTAILGGAMSSRLFLEIRERRGLAYDIHSYANKLADTGSLVTYVAVEPRQCVEVVSEVLRQLDRLRREAVSAHELEKVKDHFKGRLLLGLEDTQSVSGWCGAQQQLYGVIRQPEEVCAEVDRVEAADLLALAEECFRDEYLRLVAIGPARGERGLQDALHF
jgi:predicted Zn-dependent peptidase